MKKRQAFLYVAGNTVYLFSQWLFTVAVVRLSGYEDAGVLALAMTITNIFYIVSSYGMRSYQVSDVDETYKHQEYILSRTVTIGFGFLLCLFYTALFGYSSKQFAVIIFYMLYKTVEALSDMSYGLFQRFGRFNAICVSNCLKGILGLIVFCAAFGLTQNLPIAIAVLAISNIGVLILYDIVLINPLVKPLIFWDRHSWLRVRSLLLACVPMVVMMLTQPVLQAIPRTIFERDFSTELFGIYSAVSAPTMMITVFVSSAFMPFLPMFANDYFQNRNNTFIRNLFIATGLVLVLGLLALAAALFFGKAALTFVFGEDIEAYSKLLYPIITATLLSSLIMCYNGVFTSMRKLIPLACCSIFGCVVAAVISMPIVIRGGIYGVAYVLIAAQGAQLAIMAGGLAYFIASNKVRISDKIKTGDIE